MNRNTCVSWLFGLAGAALCVAAPVGPEWLDRIAQAGDASTKGLLIAQAADLRDEGWGDWEAHARMVLRNAHGESSEREMRLQSLEQPNDGDRRLIIFDEPKDVEGTAFLVLSKKVGNDDRWLFLPALNRVKRISSSNQSGPFVGSEFAYEDLSSQEVEKYTYRFLREESLDGVAAWVIERIPTDEKSGYTRQVAWIDQEGFRILKVDYYDRKKTLLKTLTTAGWKLHHGQWWRAAEFVMTNHQTGKSTELHWGDHTFGQRLPERLFTQANLRNAR